MTDEKRPRSKKTATKNKKVRKKQPSVEGAADQRAKPTASAKKPAAPGRTAVAAPEGGGGNALWIAALVVVVIGGYLVMRGDDETAVTADNAATASAATASAAQPARLRPTATTPPATTTTAPPTVTTEPELPPDPVASAKPPMPTPPAAPAAPAQSGDACFRAVFAPDAFGAALPALCEQTDPIEGSKAIKVALVRGGIEAKTTTAAMKEWAVLGWYETAWLAAVQARCCSPAPTLKTHAALAECKLDEAIAAIAGAVKGSDSAAVEGAIATYSDAVHCIVNRKAGKLLGQKGEPKGFEAALLKTALLRAQAFR